MTPFLSVPVLQQIGTMLEIAPEDMTAQKLRASDEASSSTTVPNDK